jgi:hypothetical protein
MRIMECAFCGEETYDLHRCVECGELFCDRCGVTVYQSICCLCLPLPDAGELIGFDQAEEVVCGASR